MLNHILIVVLLSIMTSVPSVLAHGKGSHVIGTVTSVGDDHVVVQTPKGESTTIAFQPNTTFQHNGIHSDTARPQVGDRLAAEVTKNGVPENRDWVATELKFVTPKNP
ncbi:MAG: hypothetical protein AB7P17_06555 [Nitrospirales bacterium]